MSYCCCTLQPLQLLKRAYEDSGTDLTIENWTIAASKESPTFKFWLLIHKYQQTIFTFIRTHRERKFELMVSTLRKLVPLFFPLNHQNDFEQGYWTITQSNLRFSSIPIDHAHSVPRITNISFFSLSNVFSKYSTDFLALLAGVLYISPIITFFSLYICFNEE